MFCYLLFACIFFTYVSWKLKVDFFCSFLLTQSSYIRHLKLKLAWWTGKEGVCWGGSLLSLSLSFFLSFSFLPLHYLVFLQHGIGIVVLIYSVNIHAIFDDTMARVTVFLWKVAKQHKIYYTYLPITKAATIKGFLRMCHVFNLIIHWQRTSRLLLTILNLP